MPLIKYYSLQTWFHGAREFEQAPGEGKPASGKRFYPDEYLIAEILSIYRHLRFSTTTPQDRQVRLLVESWVGKRDGSTNTAQLNALILQHISGYEAQRKKTLLLVPFLYGNHHPGIAIDISNKKAIYVDPFGTDAGYKEAAALITQLKDKGYDCTYLKQRQQNDYYSCGPILTASMMKWMEEFMHLGVISDKDFPAPRPNLATERFFQMYVNNSLVFENKPGLVSEVMLADASLWKIFLNEHGVEEELQKAILDIIEEQRKTIASLPPKWEDMPDKLSLVKSVTEFQTRLSEVLLLKNQEEACNILINLVIACNSKPWSEALANIPKQDMLALSEWGKVSAILGQPQYSLKTAQDNQPVVTAAAASLKPAVVTANVQTKTAEPITTPVLNPAVVTVTTQAKTAEPATTPALNPAVVTVTTQAKTAEPITTPALNPAVVTLSAQAQTAEPVAGTPTLNPKPAVNSQAQIKEPMTTPVSLIDPPKPQPAESDSGANPAKPNAKISAALLLLTSEILRLQKSNKAANNFWVLIGVLEVSDSKISALTELQQIITKHTEQSQALSDSLSQWKQEHGACIALERNLVHRFFAKHKPKSEQKVEELFTQLQISA